MEQINFNDENNNINNINNIEELILIVENYIRQIKNNINLLELELIQNIPLLNNYITEDDYIKSNLPLQQII